MIHRDEKPGTEIVKPTFAAELVQPTAGAIAVAARIAPDDVLWDSLRFNGQTWQREAWRFYHCIPELHYAANYVGAACSRVRVFIEHLNDYGVPDGEVTEDKEIAAIADTLFGGPILRAQALKSIGINQTIAGECYGVGRASRGTAPDKWYIASTTEIKKRNSQFAINFGFGPEHLLPGTDLILRMWTPDEERHWLADSPTHACLNVLQELEELMLFEFSQIDSRLSGAGAYFLPAEMSNGPSDASTMPQNADDVFNQMALAAQAARRGRGVAAGVVPQFIEIPGEYIGKMADKPVRFDSELSEKLKEYKDGAIKRLATGMNMPAEVLLGMGDVSHISVWSIEESFVKIHIEPMMALICEALTTGFLRKLLAAKGKDWRRYQFNFDTSPLTVRASRLQDTINLYERGLVSADAVLLSGNYNPLTDTPSEEESTERYVRELMLRDPTLIAVPALVEAANLDIEMPEPQVAAVPGDLNAPGAPPPPAPTRSVDNQRRPVNPLSTDAGPTRPANNGGTPILASGEITRAPDAVLAAANVVVRRALEISGGKLLTREYRGMFPDTPKFELHTKIKVSVPAAQDLVLGSFDNLALDMAGLDVNMDKLRQVLTVYTTYLLSSARGHDVQELARYLESNHVGG